MTPGIPPAAWASAKKTLQLGLDHPRIQAFQNGDDALQHHLPHLVLGANANFELAGRRQKKQVGGAHAVNRGDESHGDAAPDFINVIQVLHHLDESENRADDADGGRKSSGSLENLGYAFLVLGLIIEFKLHHLAKFLRLGAIHGQHQGFAKEWFFDVFEVAIERHNSFLAGSMRKSDNFLHQVLRIALCIEEDIAQLFEAGNNDAERELQHHGADGPAKHNHRGRRLDDLGKLSAFEQQARQNSHDGNQHST